MSGWSKPELLADAGELLGRRLRAGVDDGRVAGDDARKDEHDEVSTESTITEVTSRLARKRNMVLL